MPALFTAWAEWWPYVDTIIRLQASADTDVFAGILGKEVLHLSRVQRCVIGCYVGGWGEEEGEKQKGAGGRLCIDRKHVDSIHLGGGEIDIPGLLCPYFEYLSWWNLW